MPKMTFRKHEWDYPPRRPHRYNAIDEQPESIGWASSPWFTRFANIYWRVVITMAKWTLAAFFGLVLFGCLWLMLQVLKVS